MERDERISVRRLAIHLVMAFWVSPLPLGALVAARAWGRGLRRAAALALGIAAASIGMYAWFLSAPVGVAAASAGLLAVWLLAAALTAVLEHRSRLAPQQPGSEESALTYAATWALALGVACIWVAFLLAVLTSKWGEVLLVKPSMPGRVLLVGCLSLLPLGALAGLCLRSFRVPLRLGAAVQLSFASGVAALTGFFGLLAAIWLLEVVFGLHRIGTLETAWIYGPVLGLSLVAAWLAASLWIAHAGGGRDFFRRLTAFAALSVLCGWNLFMVSDELPLVWNLHRAEKAAGEARHSEAARRYLWLLRREPAAAPAPGWALDGAREALLAGDGAAARRILARCREASSPDGAEIETIDALLAAELDLTTVQRVDLEPVAQDSRLTGLWSLVLTALRTLEPELTESRAKARLQRISGSPETLELPKLGPLDAVRVAASLFGARPLVIEPEHLGELLGRGVPVLTRTEGWNLIYWRAPRADALLALDYDRWREDEKTEAEEAARLIVLDDMAGPEVGERLAMLSVLDSEARLRQALEKPNALALALVAAEEAARVAAELGIDPAVPDRLATFTRAYRAVAREAPVHAYEQASRLPEGPRRQEVLALLALDPEWREKAGAEAAARAAAALEEITTPAALARATPWFLYRADLALDAGDPSSCDLRGKLLRARAERSAFDVEAHRELANESAARGDREALLELAPRWLRAAGGDEQTLLEVLAVVATVPNAHGGSGLRALLRDWKSELSWWPTTEETDFTPLHGMAPYWAARAALADSPRQRLRWWRKAAYLAPTDAAIWSRFADALAEEGGGPEEALVQRWTERLSSRPVCPPEVESSVPRTEPAAGETRS